MITRVKAPKFRIGKYVVNEYELRTILAETAGGKPDFVGKTVTCLMSNDKSTILANGQLTNPLKGLNLVIEIIETMWGLRKG